MELTDEEWSCNEWEVEEENTLKKVPKKKSLQRVLWSSEEKTLLYKEFGKDILRHVLPQRKHVKEFLSQNLSVFNRRNINALVSFLQGKCSRTAKHVTPDVKRVLAKHHRQLTNVPL